MLHHTELNSIGAGMYSYTKGAVQQALPANFASLLSLLCVLLPEDPALLGQAPFGKLRLAFPDLRLAPRGQGYPDGAYPRGDAAERYDQGEERFHY